MKDNLFELLLNLFEQTLVQLQNNNFLLGKESSPNADMFSDKALPAPKVATQSKSIRILTQQEQMKLTKASYQFLLRMKLGGIIDTNSFEEILHYLCSSQSLIVALDETKWVIRNVLAKQLTDKQLAFLDLVLYQTEDQLIPN